MSKELAVEMFFGSFVQNVHKICACNVSVHSFT